MDYILNGAGHGDVADKILAANGDVRVLRPYIGKDGRSYVSAMNSEGKVVTMLSNTAATLTYDAWKEIDRVVIGVARPRLQFVSTLKSAGLSVGIMGGMGVTVYTSQKSSDMDDAVINMNGISQVAGDRPQIDFESVPLPVIHKDFSFDAREIAASRRGGYALDMSGAELAARKVAEQIEKLHLGVLNSYAYGGGTIYGVKNYPNGDTVTLTSPTASAWTGEVFLDQISDMCQKSRDMNFFGPWVLMYGPGWAKYLGQDYKAESDKTVRQRVSELEGINSIIPADYLGTYDIVLVQLTSDVIRTLTGMEITTVQWDSHGGMKKNFKVMAIQVPQVRSDYNLKTGLVVGTV